MKPELSSTKQGERLAGTKKEMKLYSAKGANSPRKVLIFIAEKNISDIEVVNLDLMQGEHKSPEYRAIAPNAKVPALVLDDETIITESTAICRYLEDLYPEPSLFGSSSIEKAAIEMWQNRHRIFVNLVNNSCCLCFIRRYCFTL